MSEEDLAKNLYDKIKLWNQKSELIECTAELHQETMKVPNSSRVFFSIPYKTPQRK